MRRSPFVPRRIGHPLPASPFVATRIAPSLRPMPSVAATQRPRDAPRDVRPWLHDVATVDVDDRMTPK
jgi:hypothetical protein